MVPIVAAVCVALPNPSPADGAGLDVPDIRPPRIPAVAPSAAGFAPPGWKVERALKGDLNKDGKPDLVAVLKGADRGCMVDAGNASGPVDTNPRVLLVAFGDAAGYRLHAANKAIIPRVEDPFMDDPLVADAFAVRGDVVRLVLSNFRSAGGWSTNSNTLSFRWDGARFRLIGFDRETLRRNSGETEVLSVNYLTGQAKITTGSMEDGVKDKVRARKLPPQPPQSLETMGNGLEFEPKL